jgi:hypothetical protein
MGTINGEITFSGKRATIQGKRDTFSGKLPLQRVEELGLADNHTRNTYYAQLHKDLDLASVRDWDRRANERLLTALAELPEPRLLEPDWWTFGRALGSVFDVDHDREHAQGIQRWVGQS